MYSFSALIFEIWKGRVYEWKNGVFNQMGCLFSIFLLGFRVLSASDGIFEVLI